MFMFTRIQNAMTHQSLIFVPFYIYGFSMFLALANDKRMSHRGIVATAVILLSFVNCSCFPFENNIGDTLFGKVDMYPEQRPDLGKIDDLVSFLKSRATTEDKVMFLAGSNTYDCSTFVNYPVPNANKSIFYQNNYYAASEGFPDSFLKAKYIVDISPLKQREAVDSEGVLATLKRAFYEDYRISTKFQKIGSFDLNNEAVAVIYERITTYDQQELEALIEDFSYYCEQYPEEFLVRLESYFQN